VLDTGCVAIDRIPVAGGYNFVDGNSNYNDVQGHGTARCSQIVENRTSANGIVGHAYGSSLFVCKCLNDYGGTSLSYLLAALEWCLLNGMEVVNCSWTYDSPAIAAVMDRLTRAGCWVVVAAGNYPAGTAYAPQPILFPASAHSAISVGAIQGGHVFERHIDRYAKNNRLPVDGKGISIYAYLFGIMTFKNGDYNYDIGTSVSAPDVAGFLAIIRQWLKAQGRTMLTYQLLAFLKTKWPDRAPDGCMVVGSMDWIQ
jgi:subtilisin family serine protease